MGSRLMAFVFGPQVVPRGADPAETAFSLSRVEDVRDTASACSITRGPYQANFFGVNMFLKVPSRDASKELNSFDSLQNHTETCSQRNSLDVNVVYVDFWSVGDLPMLVQMVNQARADALADQRFLRSR